jgi:hypothetical protein
LTGTDRNVGIGHKVNRTGEYLVHARDEVAPTIDYNQNALSGTDLGTLCGCGSVGGQNRRTVGKN